MARSFQTLVLALKMKKERERMKEKERGGGEDGKKKKTNEHFSKQLTKVNYLFSKLI